MEAQSPSTTANSSPANRFDTLVQAAGKPLLSRAATRVLQVNLGKLCNQACKHCHVEAGPKRTEIMDGATARRVIELAAHPAVETVDLTGGAPEMNPHFREVVEAVAGMGRQVLVRCNLTILMEEGYDWLPAFYARHKVHLVCSLPCYTADNVNSQRGGRVFEKSIAALHRLNRVGFGMHHEGNDGSNHGDNHGSTEGNGLVLDLVYNPLGPALPPAQAGLEADYRRILREEHGVRFSRLLTLANLPIGRFARDLRRDGRYEPYLQLLEGSFNEDTLPHLMCRDTLSVGWDGRVHDCDFNQMLEMDLGAGDAGLPTSILDPAFDPGALESAPIRTGAHCLGCTAGAGSSCGGALT